MAIGMRSETDDAHVRQYAEAAMVSRAQQIMT